MSSLKYNNKPFWYHVLDEERLSKVPDFRIHPKERPKYWHFDSEFEWVVYQTILNWIPKRLIQREPELILCRGVGDQNHLAISYCPDFAFTHPKKRIRYYVEAKGILTETARLKLKLFSITEPTLARKTHLVFHKSKRMTCSLPLQYHNLGSFGEWLKTLV